MNARRRLVFLMAGMGTLLRAADGAVDGRAPEFGLEPPAARAVWPQRTDGSDLFSSRKKDQPVAVAAGDSLREVTTHAAPPFVLVEVRRQGSGLRLVGHTGAGRSLRGVFALPGGGSVLARAGEPVGTEGLVVRAVELRRVREGGETVRRARAILVREVGGEVVTLDASADPEGDTPLQAILRSIPGGPTIAANVGDRVESQGRVYGVGRIGVQPPAVEIEWTDDAGAQRSLQLTPGEESGGAAP